MAKIIAITIFIAMFVMIIIDKIERQWITLVAGACTLIFVFGISMHSFDAIWETINLRSIFQIDFWFTHGESGESATGINWATIIFIAGMMIMVEGMAKAGFFRWLCMGLAKLVKYEPFPIFIAFMVMSAVLSMFIDSITVILFLAAITIELARVVYFDPVPVIMAEIFCANLGGSATMCGDPPNIIIGTSLGYTFTDFILNTGLIAGIALVIMIGFFSICFRNKLSSNMWVIKHGTKEDLERLEEDLEEEARDIYGNSDEGKVTKNGYFIMSCFIFLLAVVLLITHAMTGLTVAFIGTFIAILTLIVAGKNAIELLKKVDYKTLLFFVGLFVAVGGLEQTGVLEDIAAFIQKISGDNVMLMVAIIIWISAIASAFIDNIPFAATMVPVIKGIALSAGVPLPVLAWALALGTDIGGSASPIGASANVVGISIAGKEGYKITWGKYCKYMVPASVITLILCTVYIWVRYL